MVVETDETGTITNNKTVVTYYYAKKSYSSPMWPSWSFGSSISLFVLMSMWCSSTPADFLA